MATALTCSTTTKLRSLGGPSGVFDVTKEKSRDNPYRGHGGLVTANVHAYSVSSSSPSLPLSTSYYATSLPTAQGTSKGIDIPLPKNTYGPSATPSSTSAPRMNSMIRPSISTNMGASRGEGGLATPPSTPPSATQPPPPSRDRAVYKNATLPQPSDALLARLFPNTEDLREAISHSTPVTLETYQPGEGGTIIPVVWDGFVLHSSPPTLPSSARSRGAPIGSKPLTPPSPRSAFKGSRQAEQIAAAASRARAKPTKTLYMSVQNVLNRSVMYGDKVREMIVALLDLASEHLECDAVVMVLDRGSDGMMADGSQQQLQQKEFGEFLHSLMYVGGVVVTRPPFPIDPRYVLVGIEV